VCRLVCCEYVGSKHQAASKRHPGRHQLSARRAGSFIKRRRGSGRDGRSYKQNSRHAERATSRRHSSTGRGLHDTAAEHTVVNNARPHDKRWPCAVCNAAAPRAIASPEIVNTISEPTSPLGDGR